MGRSAEKTRRTGETEIEVRLGLDGNRSREIATGVGFFDHMLDLLAFHAGWDLTIRADGDLEIDPHHTVEDVALTLGAVLREALGDGGGIARYGSAYVPLNESLGRVVLDVCGRPHLEQAAAFPTPWCGDFPVELVEEFFRSLAASAGLTVHVDLLRCRNSHHGVEVLFKAAGRAFAEALVVTGEAPLSTKGSLNA